MRIEVKYASSEGPHPVTLDESELVAMNDENSLTITQAVGDKGNTKTTTITGTDREKWLLAKALLSSMDM